MNFWLRYALYLGRWQLSTPVLALAIVFLPMLPVFWQAVVANLIGGAMFFFVDRWIFKK